MTFTFSSFSILDTKPDFVKTTFSLLSVKILKWDPDIMYDIIYNEL